MPHTLKHKLFLFIVVFILLLTLFFNGQTATASCVEPGTPEEEFQRSDAVFTGSVVYISSANALWMDGVTRALMAMGFHPSDFYETIFPGRRVVFQVDRSWKGVNTSSVMIRTGYNNWDSSAYPFEIGSYYLVYASHAYGDPDKYLLTSLCHSTIESPNNSEDIAYLNTLPTLSLRYFPVILRILDTASVIIILLLLGYAFIFWRRKKKNKIPA